MPTHSERDVTAEIERRLRASGPRGIEILPAFRNASTHPPITPDSLAELDMPRIINNPKLRHGVNFGFMPVRKLVYLTTISCRICVLDQRGGCLVDKTEVQRGGGPEDQWASP